MLDRTQKGLCGYEFGANKPPIKTTGEGLCGYGDEEDEGLKGMKRWRGWKGLGYARMKTWLEYEEVEEIWRWGVEGEVSVGRKRKEKVKHIWMNSRLFVSSSSRRTRRSGSPRLNRQFHNCPASPPYLLLLISCSSSLFAPLPHLLLFFICPSSSSSTSFAPPPLLLLLISCSSSFSSVPVPPYLPTLYLLIYIFYSSIVIYNCMTFEFLNLYLVKFLHPYSVVDESVYNIKPRVILVHLFLQRWTTGGGGGWSGQIV